MFQLARGGYSLWLFYEQPEGETVSETVKADDIKENYSFGEESVSAHLKETDVTVYVFPSTVYYDLYTKGCLEYDSLNSKLKDNTYSHDTYYYADNTPTSYKCLPEDKFGYITPKLDDTGSIEDKDNDGNPEFEVKYKKASNGADQVYPSATQIHRNKGGLSTGKSSEYYEIKTIDALAYPKFVSTTNYSHYGGWYDYTDEILRWTNGEYYAGRFIKKHDTYKYYYASSASKLNPYGIDTDYYNEVYKFYDKYYVDEVSAWNVKNGDLTTSTFYRYDSDATTEVTCNNPWSSYYMGDPDLDATPKDVFVNSLQAYGRNHHYIDKFGYWSNLNYQEGRYLPIKLNTNTSMTADWFDSIVKNLNCDMLSDLSTTEGNNSPLGAKAWGGYSFSGFTYITKNSDGTYNYPYSDMMDMYNSYTNDQIFDPFQNLLDYATYEDTDGDGVEDKYVVRLFPIYSMGKNLSTTNAKYNVAVDEDNYPYYPEGYDSNTIGLYDSYRLKITYKDTDTSPVYDKQRYFYYTYSNEYVVDDDDGDETDYETLYAGSTYCTLQNFQLKSNMATVEFQLACKTYGKDSENNKWSMSGHASDWLTLMTATQDDLSVIFATYGDNIYINLYIFSDDIFGIKYYKGETATDITNINRHSYEEDSIFSSLTNKEINGINVKGDYTIANSSSPSNTTEGVNIIDISTSADTKSYSVRHRSFLFGLEYVRNIKLITGQNTSGIQDSETDASTLASTLKNSYSSARQYSRTRENMAVNYRDSYDSEEVTTHAVEDKYAYRYIIENVNLVDLTYGTLFNLVYPDPTSSVSQNVVFWPGSYMYARKDDGSYAVDENGRPKKYTSSLLYKYTKDEDSGTYTYAREFVSADNYFSSNKASMGDSGNLYWWQDTGSKNGLYDLILIKEPLKNTYYVFAYKHTNIFAKIFAEDVEVDSDGYAIHDETKIKETNTMLFDRSYDIGDTMHGEDLYLGRSLEDILAGYFASKSIADYSNYVLKDHVTGRIVATYEQDASSSSYALTFVDSFKIRKNYIFYLAEA